MNENPLGKWTKRTKSVEETNRENVLTCVYCGHAYPPGSPTHGAAVLTAHIKVCPQHPLRAAEALIADLLKALKKLERVSSAFTHEQLDAKAKARAAIAAAEKLQKP